MQTQILGLLAETSIHPGAGRSAGFVDLPVAREAATDFPVIVGSSFKGALRSAARSHPSIDDQRLLRVFGEQDQSGLLIVSDARLATLPVRSLTGAYKWVTSPLILERLRRDLGRAGHPAGFAIKAVAQGQYLGAGEGALFLEERQFEKAGDLDCSIADAIGALLAHEETRKRVSSSLVVLHDDDFTWFARYGLAVTARNVLDETKKTSMNLWYEETLPCDSVFYALLADRSAEGVGLGLLQDLLEQCAWIQIGGNETVGQGWFAVQRLSTEVSA